MFSSYSKEDVMIWVTRVDEDRQVVIIIIVGEVGFLKLLHVQIDGIVEYTWQDLNISFVRVALYSTAGQIHCLNGLDIPEVVSCFSRSCS